MELSLFSNIRVKRTSNKYGGQDTEEMRMNDGRFVSLYDGGVEVTQDGQTLFRIYSEDPLEDAEIISVSKDSRYVLISDDGYNFEFWIADLEEKILFPFRNPKKKFKNEKMCFGPDGNVILLQPAKLVLVDYTNTRNMRVVAKHRLPAGLLVNEISSDEDRMVFLDAEYYGKRGLYLADDEIVKLFEIETEIEDELEVKTVTPSIICAHVDSFFHLFDLVKMQLIEKYELPAPLRPHFSVSPDGRYIFRVSDNTIYISLINEKTVDMAVSLPSKIELWKEGGLSLDVYLREGLVRQIQFVEPFFLDVDGIFGNRMAVDTLRGEFDLIFEKSSFPSPVETVEHFNPRSTCSGWARIMSNNTFETHLTWPAPGLLINTTNAPRVIKAARDAGFGEMIISLAAWAADNTPREKYIMRLVQAIAQALR